MQTQTLNIVLPKELAKKADKLAKKEYKSRSALIRDAIRAYLARSDKNRSGFTGI